MRKQATEVASTLRVDPVACSLTFAIKICRVHLVRANHLETYLVSGSSAYQSPAHCIAHLLKVTLFMSRPWPQIKLAPPLLALPLHTCTACVAQLLLKAEHLSRNGNEAGATALHRQAALTGPFTPAFRRRLHRWVVGKVHRLVARQP